MKEKIIASIKENWKFLLTHFSLLLVVLMIATTMFIKPDYTLQLPGDNVFANITYAITILFGVIMYFALKYFEKKEVKLENIYLSLIIPLGIMYCIANPLGMVPDEDQHAKKSMAISNGVFFSHKDENGNPVDKFNGKLHEVCTRTITSYEEAYNRVTAPETDFEVEMIYSMATYAPICHMPQALGMFLTRILGGGVSLQCYIARLFNMAFAIILTYFAIKIIPIKKQIVFFLGLLPLTIMEYASMSSDALTISSCLFYISYILNLKYNDEIKTITVKDMIIIFITSMVVSLCKIVYVPLCLLVFLLPKEKFKSNKAKLCYTIGTFIAAIVLNIVWLIYASTFLTEVNPRVNAVEQVKYILTNPISYILILFRSIHIYNQTFILSLCGEGLGHYNAQASVLFVFPCLVLFAMLFFVNEDKKKKEINWLTKLICLFIFVSIVLLIYTSLYVAWTPVRHATIKGVQSRYFLPVVLLTALVLDNKTIVFDKKLKDKYISSFMLFFNINALSCISFTYIFNFIINIYVK